MISGTDARQSAIFWSLGHYYEWSLSDVAERVFRMPYGLLIQDLIRMGFSIKEIQRLQNNDHPKGWCRTCRKKVEPHKVFCSDTCEKKENSIRQLILHGYIPITLSKYGYYDLNKERYITQKELMIGENKR